MPPPFTWPILPDPVPLSGGGPSWPLPPGAAGAPPVTSAPAAPSSFSWPLIPDPAELAVSNAANGASPIDNVLGFGLLRPFQRDRKNDYATDGGAALVKASVGQILGTRAQSGTSQGELPWRQDFGSKLHMLRMRKGISQDELARVYAQEALRKWESRVSVSRVVATFDRVTRARTVDVQFDVIDRNKPGNNVLLRGLTTSVAIP